MKKPNTMSCILVLALLAITRPVQMSDASAQARAQANASGSGSEFTCMENGAGDSHYLAPHEAISGYTWVGCFTAPWPWHDDVKPYPCGEDSEGIYSHTPLEGEGC
jgi:hypothetical protein